MVVYYGRKYGTLWLWILPYTLFSIFAGMVYFSLHHLGIGFFAYFFWAWCTYGEAKNSPESLVEYKWMKQIRVGMISAALIIGVIWNVGACRLEWRNMQALGENQANFIKEHHLDDYKMMTGWHNFGAIGLNTRYHFITECVMPYFEHNEFYNYNGGIDEKGYLLNRKPTQAEMDQDLAAWRKLGEPDVLYHLSAGEWEMVFPADDYQKYRSVYVGNCDRVWKNTLLPFYRTFIRVREDLLEETGLADGCVIVKN